MSYAIVRSIKVREGKVFLNCASNNVRPLHFSEDECPSLTKILQENGGDALELEIFRNFESGNFQRGVAKYLRALKVLHNMPEYQAFNWRNNGKEYEEANKKRETEAFNDLLRKALRTQLPREKFIITKDYCGNKVFLSKITRRFAKWRPEGIKAKIFRYKNEAETIKKWFNGSDQWMVEMVA